MENGILGRITPCRFWIRTSKLRYSVTNLSHRVQWCNATWCEIKCRKLNWFISDMLNQWRLKLIPPASVGRDCSQKVLKKIQQLDRKTVDTFNNPTDAEDLNSKSFITGIIISLFLLLTLCLLTLQTTLAIFLFITFPCFTSHPSTNKILLYIFLRNVHKTSWASV